MTPTPEPRISPSQNTESDPIPELLQGAKGSTWVDSNLTVDQFLRSHGLTRLRVPGDGHCILYAVSLSLRSCGICLDDENAVASRMVAEINDNLAFYGQFTDSLIPDVLKYINEKSYTSETADLIINILSNAYGVGTTVIRMGQNGNCSLVQQNPRYASPHPRRIFLYRTGEGNATHYDAVTDMGAQLDGKLFADSSVDLILGARADDTRDISADDTADKTCVISIDNTGTSTDNTGIISNDKDVASRGGYSLCDGWYICAAVLTPFFHFGRIEHDLFGVFFLIHQHKYDLLGTNPRKIRSFWPQNTIFPSIFLGPIFSGPRHTPSNFRTEYPPRALPLLMTWIFLVSPGPLLQIPLLGWLTCRLNHACLMPLSICLWMLLCPSYRLTFRFNFRFNLEEQTTNSRFPGFNTSPQTRLYCSYLHQDTTL